MRKIIKFQLISWSGNFVKRHCFRIVSDESHFPQNCHARKLSEISVFYAVINAGTPMVNVSSWR